MDSSVQTELEEQSTSKLSGQALSFFLHSLLALGSWMALMLLGYADQSCRRAATRHSSSVGRRAARRRIPRRPRPPHGNGNFGLAAWPRLVPDCLPVGSRHADRAKSMLPMRGHGETDAHFLQPASAPADSSTTTVRSSAPGLPLRSSATPLARSSASGAEKYVLSRECVQLCLPLAPISYNERLRLSARSPSAAPAKQTPSRDDAAWRQFPRLRPERLRAW